MLKCCGKFKPDETWFLKSTDEFYARRMLSGHCPECGTWVVAEFKKRYSDGEIVTDIAKKQRKAQALYNKCKKDLNYKHSGIIQRGTRMKGSFIHGANKEIHNCLGKVIAIRQRAVNLNGDKSLIKEITIK
jgi:hypothetical protein